MKVSRCSPRAWDNDKNFTISWVIHEINSRYAQGAWKKEYGLIHSKLAYESSCKWKLPILFSPSPTKKYENPLICSKCHFSFVVSLHHLKRSDNWHDFYPHNTWELCCVSIFSLMISSCWVDLKLTLGFKSSGLNIFYRWSFVGDIKQVWTVPKLCMTSRLHLNYHLWRISHFYIIMIKKR